MSEPRTGASSDDGPGARSGPVVAVFAHPDDAGDRGRRHAREVGRCRSRGPPPRPDQRRPRVERSRGVPCRAGRRPRGRDGGRGGRPWASRPSASWRSTTARSRTRRTSARPWSAGFREVRAETVLSVRPHRRLLREPLLQPRRSSERRLDRAGQLLPGQREPALLRRASRRGTRGAGGGRGLARVDERTEPHRGRDGHLPDQARCPRVPRESAVRWDPLLRRGPPEGSPRGRGEDRRARGRRSSGSSTSAEAGPARGSHPGWVAPLTP